jgi:hypothetical protein
VSWGGGEGRHVCMLCLFTKCIWYTHTTALYHWHSTTGMTHLKNKCYILIDWVKRWVQAVTFCWQRLTTQRLAEHLATVNLPQSIYIGPVSVRFRATHWLLASGTKVTSGSDRLRTTFCSGSHSVSPIWSQNIYFILIYGSLNSM